MQITKLSYIDTNWELTHLELDSLNLIIAKNSTGKSRTLMTIDLLVKMLTQKRNLNWGGRWNIEFLTHSKQTVIYDFATSQQNGVTAEKITLNGQQVLFRHRDGQATIKNKLTNHNDTVYPPKDKLLLHTHRDIRKYPFLEEIIEWAEQSYGFKFGNISPFFKLTDQEYDLLTTVDDIPSLYKALNKESKEKVLEQFNIVGFNVTEIKAEDKGEFTVIKVKEDGIEKPLPHYKLSQGMFRSLAVIIFLEYLICRKKPSTVIIDDLCEGLDYERAKNLGQLIFEKCKDTEIQLIATSNDSFLMDVVDIKYWNILRRSGNKVDALNNKNSSEIFRKFRFTGLSNFDFFSSDFLLQQTQ